MVPSPPLYVLPDTPVINSPASISSHGSLEASPSINMNNDDTLVASTEGLNCVDNNVGHNTDDSVAYSSHIEEVGQPVFNEHSASPVHSQLNATTDELLSTSHEDAILQHAATETVDSSVIVPSTTALKAMLALVTFVDMVCDTFIIVDNHNKGHYTSEKRRAEAIRILASSLNGINNLPLHNVNLNNYYKIAYLFGCF
ncbi:hypothetical protein V6N11_076573 [Hibiscus sabdariffa]|uniref:Uncharacterized protein n=1 Tax=Hibiscus sabdariffa TaxID=183260 RepID=A0ABR2Q6P6_9ROSI